jgi:hypothetical protein
MLSSTASVELEGGVPVCVLTLTARADSPAWLVLALRPANTEGISLINDVVLSPDRKTWVVDDEQTIVFMRRRSATWYPTMAMAMLRSI